MEDDRELEWMIKFVTLENASSFLYCDERTLNVYEEIIFIFSTRYATSLVLTTDICTRMLLLSTNFTRLLIKLFYKDDLIAFCALQRSQMQ